MADSIVRQKTEPAVQEEVPKVETGPIPEVEDHIEVPYTESKDFLEDYFGIGTEWQDQEMEFFNEVEIIDHYIKFKIKEGEIANSPKAVEGMLKKIEKLHNLQNEGRAVVKLEVISNYIDFLMKNEDLKSKLRRYNAS
ncbi:MAG: hypothetical protein KJ888_20740 [Gammaproteobacteria bacterium]|uniref:Uncharacterized protein n=1 Tax=viral metagenome TaxID=1070528 RepID=A0A6M3J3Q2_9ZZZZ|nr:hypothetical protein [Gammaproteobacteria bacterium]